MSELHYTASEQAARKAAVLAQFEIDKQEALRLVTQLTEVVRDVSHFSMCYGVNDVDDFICYAKTVRKSIYECVESIENDQKLSRE